MRMRSDGASRKLVLVLLGLFSLVMVQIFVSRMYAPEPRKFTGTWLSETHYQEIRFRNTTQNIDLAGLLFVPDGEGAFPAAIIIHGSGTSQRNNGWYLTLVEFLQRKGVAVLLPDKRGSESSGGDWRTSSFEDLATDTLAAVHWLARHEAVDSGKIGVIGMSEGGHIAPLVAIQSPELTFVVSVVSSAIPMHELLVYEENHNLRQFGVPPGLSNVFAYPAAWSLIYLRQKPHWDAIGNFDTVPHWKQVSTDTLVLYGEKDTNVPSARSAEILRSMGKPNIRVKVYPDSGHALESPVGEGDSIFRDDALQDIVDFIREASGL